MIQDITYGDGESETGRVSVPVLSLLDMVLEVRTPQILIQLPKIDIRVQPSVLYVGRVVPVLHMHFLA